MSVEWYDRNPKTITEEYDESVAGHTKKERLSYICPTGKIAMVELLSVNAARTGGATSLGWVNVNWRVIPKGLKEDRKILTLNFLNDTPGDLAAKIEKTLTSSLMLFAGDKLILTTSDASTGGSVSYECAYKITEFDAFAYTFKPTVKPWFPWWPF